MIPQLASAISGGYSTSQILQFLLRQFPQHSKQITKALKQGFTADQIVKFLGGGRKSVTQESEGLTEHEQTRSKDIQRRENVNQGALKGAGMAALAGGASLAAPMAKSALQRAAPQLFGPGAVTGASNNAVGRTGQTQLPTLPNQQTQPSAANPQLSQTNLPSSQPSVTPSLPQQPQAVQPQVNAINPSEILSKYPGFEKKIADMIQSKNTPEAIAQYFKQFNPSQTKKLEKEAGQPIENIIAEYMQSNVNPDVKPLDIEANVEEKKPLNREEALGKFREKIIQSHEKGSTVSSPEGIGEIKEIRNGKAIIDIDGKKHQVNEDEIEPPAFTEDEIADAYDEMFRRIPEEHKSGFIQWAGYDENRNVLGFIPRGGKYEELENITPEEAEIIKQGKGIARTSGEEREGLWVMGEDTRGGLISQIIHDRKKKHKKESENQLEFGIELPKPEKQDRGMKPIFSELEYPRSLSQARDKKKRDEERVRLKKERDEAKKRKK